MTTPRTRTAAQQERQTTRRQGQYSKMNPCYCCGKSAGHDYCSAARTDTSEFGDLGLVLCNRCCAFVDAIADDVQAIAFLRAGVGWGGPGPAAWPGYSRRGRKAGA